MEKKEKVQIYFGKNGITSTSANYVCNIAKELIRNDQADLDKVNFTNTVVCTADSNSVHTLRKGYTEQDLEALPQKIERIAKIKSLIGWLREGIKEKEKMLEEVKKMNNWTVLEKIGYEQKERRDYMCELSEEEYVKTLPKQEQVLLQLLNTRAAIYGKAVHVDGPIGKARVEMINSKHSPAQLEREGGVTLTEVAPSLNTEKVDEVFLDLQNKYREAQKELNSKMFKIQEDLQELNIEIMNENENIEKENAIAEREERDAVVKWKKKERKRIGDLKIVVPQELKELFDEINNM